MHGNLRSDLNRIEKINGRKCGNEMEEKSNPCKKCWVESSQTLIQ